MQATSGQTPYAAPHDVALYQLEMAIDALVPASDLAGVNKIAERILPLVRAPNGNYMLPQDFSPVIELQILISVIDRCTKRTNDDTASSEKKSAFVVKFLGSIFDSHLKTGYFASLCQLASLATGLGSAAVLNPLAQILEQCPSQVLHAVFACLTTDYLILCPKAFSTAVGQVAKHSLPFASILCQGALLSARQMSVQKFDATQFRVEWLEIVTQWLSDYPSILLCSNSLITSISNFVILVTTIAAIAEAKKNGSVSIPSFQAMLGKLTLLAEQLNKGLLLAAFSCKGCGLKNSGSIKMSSSELTGLSFALFTETTTMIGSAPVTSQVLDVAITRLLQQIEALRSAGIIQSVSRDDLLLLKSKFQPVNAAILIDILVDRL